MNFQSMNALTVEIHSNFSLIVDNLYVFPSRNMAQSLQLQLLLLIKDVCLIIFFRKQKFIIIIAFIYSTRNFRMTFRRHLFITSQSQLHYLINQNYVTCPLIIECDFPLIISDQFSYETTIYIIFRSTQDHKHLKARHSIIKI